MAATQKTKVVHLVLDGAGRIAAVYLDAKDQACSVAAAVKGVVVEAPLIADYRQGHS